jgi:hypothetical protein
MDRKLVFFFSPCPIHQNRSLEKVDGVGPALSQLFFFPRDNLANVGTSERKLTGNAKIEQQQQEFSSSLETREERKKNSSDWMLLASSLLLCIRSLTKDNFPPLAFPLPIVA